MLIDSNSLINRAYFALPAMTTSRGLPIGAVYGFTSMLIKLIEKYRPKYLAAVFDVHAPTFRHKLTPIYKATRKPMPSDLVLQVESLKLTLDAMHIKRYELSGYEADDIIGTMAKSGVFTYILTGDRDSLQLVNANTHALLTKRGISDILEVTPQNAAEVFGVPPDKVVDFKALAGDSSDNIPGVPGIGEKSAAELLSVYSCLDDVYAHLNDIGGKKAEKLALGKDSAYLSQQLAAIDTCVPIDFNAEDCVLEFPFPQSARDKFAELEFKSLAAKSELFADNAAASSPVPTAAQQIKVTTLTCDAELESVVNGIDSDTVALAILKDGLHFAANSATDYFAPITGDLTSPFTLEGVLRRIQALLTKRVITFGLKTTLHKIAPYTIDNAQDVALMGYLLEYRLEPRTAAELLELYCECQNRLSEKDMIGLYSDIELPLSRVLFDMETTGFTVDKTRLDELDARFSELQDKSAKRILQLYGGEFNLNSPKQLAKALFEDLGIPYPGKPPYSTKAEILQKLSGSYEIVDELLKYRFNSKLKSTFIDGLRAALHPDGTVHTSFNQMTTATGRLSSTEPNLQNIPARTEEGKLLRSMFVAKPGRVLIDADYSQIELKLLAHFSGDKKLIDAFNNGGDVHTSTAAEVFGIPVDQVTPELRRDAKAVNFGIVYGISNYGLSQNIHIPPKKAKAYIDRYFERFPKVKEYLDGLIASAKARGYAVTAFNRRRAIPELNSAKYTERQFGERVAMNMPLQGTAADIIKIAMNRVFARLNGMRAKLILQVHDELIVDAPQDEADEVVKLLREEMENAATLSVPLNVDIAVGQNWMECK